MDVARQRRRLVTALVITGVCLAVALGAIVGDFGFHLGWMIWVFAGAMVTGFASHGWLMLGMLKNGRAP